MKEIQPAVQGWRIVGLSTLAVGTMVAVIWLVHGIDEQGMRMVLRATARTSCIFFLGAFVASALHKIWSTRFSAWLVKNRRYLGLSFAVSHSYHAIAWSGLWFLTPGFKFDPLAVLGYVFLIAMTVTSFQRPAAWLGKRAWKILHNAGMHYFWLAFTVEFSLKIPKSMLIYSPFAVLLVLAMMLRLIAPRMQRKLAA